MKKIIDTNTTHMCKEKREIKDRAYFWEVMVRSGLMGDEDGRKTSMYLFYLLVPAFENT